MIFVSELLKLCKLRVVALMLLTVLVGMALASKQAIPMNKLFFTLLGVGLASSAAAVINHLLDHRIDAVMLRTQHRPIPKGKIHPQQALMFALFLAAVAMLVLFHYVNSLTAWLTLASFIGYAFLYTGILKRLTPQNIVIGGMAGAIPPLLGWTAMTGNIHPYSWLLVLIIFVWTPPHFWALAIHRQEEYAKVNVPMLPVTHGIQFTKWHILFYTILLLIATLLPYLTGMSHLFYLLCTIPLNAIFLYYAIKLFSRNEMAMPAFYYSIIYLALLFTVMLIDHYAY